MASCRSNVLNARRDTVSLVDINGMLLSTITQERALTNVGERTGRVYFDLIKPFPITKEIF